MELCVRPELESLNARFRTERDERDSVTSHLARDLQELGANASRRLTEIDDRTAGHGKPPASAYAELRRLLLLEGEQLSRLNERWSDPHLRAEDLADVLPASFRVSARKHPAALAQALLPILGAAARQALSLALRRPAQGLRRLVEQSFTRRGWRWSWQSFATKGTFPDIALA